MDSLLNSGQYNDYSELIAVAIENLSILDREISKTGQVVFEVGEHIPRNANKTPQVISNKRVTADGAATSLGPRKVMDRPAQHAKTEPLLIPDVFGFLGLEELSVLTVASPQERSNGEIYTLDRWLFGQYNRLLPVKANCRALARFCASQENGKPLEETAAVIADAAALLGDYLADIDLRHQIGRDDALATAFPRSGPDAEKSRSRYANQFVGSVNSQGVLSGLLSDYRLAGLRGGMAFQAMNHGQDARGTSEPHLVLTDQGLRFARLGNPVLDSQQATPTQRFSQEEISFLLDHIRSYVSVENFAFQTLAHAIAEGADTPDKLDEAIQSLVPADSKRSFSPSYLTSQRSGALSRMAELGLIERQRKGVRVRYVVTLEGRRLVD